MTNAPVRPGRRPLLHRRILLAAVVSVTLLTATVLAVQLLQVHGSTGDWRLTAAAAPSQLQYKDQTYHIDLDATDPERPIGMVSTGKFTQGGGEILTGLPIGESPAAPLWLMVVADNTNFFYLRNGADHS